jgi:hypothetical protein
MSFHCSTQIFYIFGVIFAQIVVELRGAKIQKCAIDVCCIRSRSPAYIYIMYIMYIYICIDLFIYLFIYLYICSENLGFAWVWR